MRRRGNTRGKERNTKKKQDPMVAWKDDSFESEDGKTNVLIFLVLTFQVPDENDYENVVGGKYL